MGEAGRSRLQQGRRKTHQHAIRDSEQERNTAYRIKSRVGYFQVHADRREVHAGRTGHEDGGRRIG